MRTFTLLRMLLAPALLVAAPVLADSEADNYPGWGWPIQDCIMYEVKPGDYCYKIAQDNGIPYAQFLRQNPGIDCTNLQVGQSVCLIPLSPNNHSGGGGGGGWTGGYKRQCKTHTVRSGEVCDEIADSYGIPLAELVARNDQSSEWRGCSLLRIGQQLCV
ncbi:hypothetical protein H4R21_000162 [Coemansia helicoidea]|uniref:Uncharacterized protein n=1 Tax=Coemansia helicoidea TaxID=1286919 RepID=A0ACC1LGV6_9FUNG|nr:hypothetical protein H4R21_000162 [Coemansia helicoidea]